MSDLPERKLQQASLKIRSNTNLLKNAVFL